MWTILKLLGEIQPNYWGGYILPPPLVSAPLIRGMLIEKNFKLRGPGPPGRICTPITGCFHDKTIICMENFRLDCYFMLKDCWRQCTLRPPTLAKSLPKFNPKMQDFKRVLNLNC